MAVKAANLFDLKGMLMKYALFAAALGLAACSTTGPAYALQQGQPAPAAVVEQLQNTPVTKIGKHSVRAVPPAAAVTANTKMSPAALAAQGKTLVVRERDHLVGISSHELVVITPELDAVAAKVANLNLEGATTKLYPKLNLLIVKTAHFEQLQTVRDQVAKAFPDAKFDLPVTYYPKKPQ